MTEDRQGMEPAQLRRIRDVMGWTQAEAAAKVEVAENTWARWERGELSIHRARVALLQRLLHQAEKRAARRAKVAVG